MENLKFIEKIIFVVMFIMYGVIIGYDSGNMSTIYLDFAEYAKNKDDFLRELILCFSIGSIVGGIIFSSTPMSKLIPLALLYIADISAIIGYVVMSKSEVALQIYVGRAVVGAGLMLMSISMPIIIIQIWPKKCNILATSGLSYQIGMVLSQIINSENWRAILSSYVWILIPHIGMLTLVLCIMNKGDDGQSRYQVEGVLKSCRTSVAAALIVQLSSSILGIQDFNLLADVTENDLADYVSVSALLGSLISIVLVYYFRRKVLLLTCLSLLTLEMILMGTFIPSCGQLISKLLVCTYVITLSSVMSGLPYVYTFEVFPREYRSVGFPFVCLLNALLQMLIFLCLDQLTRDHTIQFTLYVNAVLSLLGVILTHFFVLETKDSSA